MTVQVLLVPLMFGASSLHAMTLTSYIDQVWQSSPFMQEADAKVQQAEAEMKAASKWLYNPDFTASREKKDKAKNSHNIGISQTIDISGKFLTSGKMSRLELEAVKAEREQMRQELAINVLTAIVERQAALDIITLSEQRMQLMQQFLDFSKKSYAAGDHDKSAYNLAQLAYSEALIHSTDATIAMADSQETLNVSLGFCAGDLGSPPMLPKALPTISIPVQEMENTLKALPKLQILQFRKEATYTKISHARRNRIPDPTISVAAGKDEGDSIIGLSVSFPLNVFNTYGAEVDAAKHQTLSQEKSLLSTYHTMKLRFYNSRKKYELAKDAWQVWINGGERARLNQIEVLEKKFRVNEISAIDYLVQIQQTIDTQIEAIQLHENAWKLWLEWLSASGHVAQWLGESR